MKFCKKCSSIYFLKIIDSKLNYLCKNCGDIEPWIDSDKCVYTSDLFRSDSMSHQFKNSPYTFKDPTLPRLNSVKCINDNCLTNTNNSNLILIHSDNVNKTNFKTLIESNYKGTTVDILYTPLDLKDIGEHGELHTNCGKIDMPTEDLHIEKVEVSINGQSITIEELESLINYLNETQIDTNNLFPSNPKYLNNVNNTTPILNKLLREIISIKYNDMEMKYMYICSTCASTWKNAN